jgi:hypothetical protein
MRVPAPCMVLLLAGLAVPGAALCSSTADDRIALSANGSTLSGTNGGGGGSLGWLHNFDTDALASVAVEHQGIANSQWTFGSILGSLGSTRDGTHYSVYGEIHEGAGDEGARAFHYQIEAAGVTATYFHRLSAQLEDRQIDVQPTHGNLPKLALSYQWNPHVLTSASFASSVSGNLGTHLGGLRLDYYAAKLSFLAGVAYGQASPVVLNIDIGLVIPGRRLKEGYVGVSKSFPRVRGELALVADYLDLSGSRRGTLTLNYIFHVGHASAVR